MIKIIVCEASYFLFLSHSFFKIR